MDWRSRNRKMLNGAATPRGLQEGGNRFGAVATMADGVVTGVVGGRYDQSGVRILNQSLRRRRQGAYEHGRSGQRRGGEGYVFRHNQFDLSF